MNANNYNDHNHYNYNDHNHYNYNDHNHYKKTQNQQKASQEDIERNLTCVQDLHQRLSQLNIIFKRGKLDHQLIIPVPICNTNYILNYIISVHCPSLARYKWLYVTRETFENNPADIYLGYDPSTRQPEGFAPRDQLFRRQPPGRDVWVYGIEREKLEKLDPKLNQLFGYLLKLTTSYV